MAAPHGEESDDLGEFKFRAKRIVRCNTIDKMFFYIFFLVHEILVSCNLVRLYISVSKLQCFLVLLIRLDLLHEVEETTLT